MIAAPPSQAPVEVDGWPDPVGLMSGIFAVICGQIVVLCYHYWHVHFCGSRRIQTQDVHPSPFWPGTLSHLSQPEGFILLGGYLTGTWMFNLMPKTYYRWEGGFNISHIATQVDTSFPASLATNMCFDELVAIQLVINDFLQTMMHYGVSHTVPWTALICTNKPSNSHRSTNSLRLCTRCATSRTTGS